MFVYCTVGDEGVIVDLSYVSFFYAFFGLHCPLIEYIIFGFLVKFDPILM